jgi:hypothetical protein
MIITALMLMVSLTLSAQSHQTSAIIYRKKPAARQVYKKSL